MISVSCASVCHTREIIGLHLAQYVNRRLGMTTNTQKFVEGQVVEILPSVYCNDGWQGEATVIETQNNDVLVWTKNQEVWFNRNRISVKI
jgi:recombination DNA repair RAD52 pathway protein